MFGRLAPWLRRPVAGFPTGDLILAGALCAIAVASVLTGNPYEGPAYITLPVAIVTTAALAWRVRSPAVSVLLVVAAEIVQTFTSQVPGSLWSLVVSIIVVYSVAAHYPEGRAAIGGLVMVGSSMLQERVDNGVDYLFIVILFGGTWLLGRASRLWRTQGQPRRAAPARPCQARGRGGAASHRPRTPRRRRPQPQHHRGAGGCGGGGPRPRPGPRRGTLARHQRERARLAARDQGHAAAAAQRR